MLVAQSCLTLCGLLDCSPPGSSVHGILQLRILEWVAISLLQGIFPTQGSNPGLPHCRWILYQLNHAGSPRTLEWVAYPFSTDLPNPGIEPRSPTLQVDSLPSKPPGKLKNTGMGSLSLFQGIFLTQESNRGLLRYRWILYQLSY